MLDEKSPWKFWKAKAKTLKEAETRTKLMMDDQIHQSESNWWYGSFFLVYFFISLPVKQLQLVNRFVRSWLRPPKKEIQDTKDDEEEDENGGILKQFVCILLIPLWITILLLVYLVIFTYCALDSLSRGVYFTAVYLWKGRKQMERERNRKNASRGAKEEEPEAPDPSDSESDSDYEYDNFSTSATSFSRTSTDSKRTAFQDEAEKDEIPHLWIRPIAIMRLELLNLPKKANDVESTAAAGEKGKGKKTPSVKSKVGSTRSKLSKKSKTLKAGSKAGSVKQLENVKGKEVEVVEQAGPVKEARISKFTEGSLKDGKEDSVKGAVELSETVKDS